jgi:hypothetical protein
LKDNGVTLAKMAGLARGSIIHGDSSGDPAALAKGGANTVLSSDGTDLSYSAVTNAMLAGSIVASKMNGAIFEDLETLGAASADGEFIVATGAGAFAYESGNTARTSLGLGTGDSPQFASMTLSGDLTVNGSMTTISTTNLDVEDNLILLGKGSEGAGHANDMGLVFRTGNDQKDHGFIYDQSVGQFAMVKEAANSDLMNAAATGNLTIDAYADLRVNRLIADSIEAVMVETVQTISADATLNIASGSIALCNSAGGNITITLPASSGNQGKIVKFKKIATANNVVIDGDSSETIDGSATITLESPYAAVSLISDGSNWFVM